MHPKDIAKTAFIVPGGVYCWLTMPFGARNSGATFMRTMQKIFQNVSYEKLAKYLDDLLIQGKTTAEHLEILREVLEILAENNLKIKAKKCELFRASVTFLGHIVSKDGVQCETTKVECIRNYPTPTNPKEVRQALGLFSFYRRHVEKFSDVAKPLYYLTTKNATFDWTTECEQAFRMLIERLTNAPVLANPKLGEELVLTTDASQTGIGALLSVIRDDLRHPVAYGSHLLNPAQRNYSATKKELFAIVFFTQAFRFWLLGLKSFRCETDCRPLVWITSFRDPQGITARWLEKLARFNMKIVYRPGKQNQAADALSRIHAGSEPDDSANSLQINLIMDKVDNDPDMEVNVTEQPDVPTPPILPFSTWNTLNTPDFDQRLEVEQMKDPDLKRLFQLVFLKSPIFPDREPPITLFYYHKRDSLSRVPGRNAMMYKGKGNQKCILVPRQRQTEVLKSTHSGPTGGHRSAAKMMSVLKSTFYWKSMRYDAELYAKNCASCGVMKKPPRKPNAPITMTATSCRLQKLSIDIVGKLPRTKNGNVFILTVLDCFTKFAWAFPLAKITSESIANQLVKHIFSVFGLPLQIQSDAGSQLISQMMQELYAILGINQKQSLPWQPRCNGIVERLHRTIEGSMAHWAEKKPRSWDKILPLCILSYNTQVANSTGIAPFKLMFGHNARLPVHFIFGEPPLAENVPEFEYNMWLEETFYQLEHQARTKLQASMQSIKDYADRKQFGKPLQPGTFVWLMKGAFERGCRKFSRKFSGPYKVHEKQSNTTYVLKQTKHPFKTFRAHFNRLKRCHLPAATLAALNDTIEREIEKRREEDEIINNDHHTRTTCSQPPEDDEIVIIVNPDAAAATVTPIIPNHDPITPPVRHAPTPLPPYMRRSARIAQQPRVRYNVNCVRARKRKLLLW